MQYPDEIADARLQVVADAMDAGAGNAVLEVGTADMALILARIDLNKPAASVAARTLTLAGLPAESLGLADGVPAEARVVDSDGNVVVDELQVGSDVTVDSGTISTGQTVRINSGVIRHP